MTKTLPATRNVAARNAKRRAAASGRRPVAKASAAKKSRQGYSPVARSVALIAFLEGRVRLNAAKAGTDEPTDEDFKEALLKYGDGCHRSTPRRVWRHRNQPKKKRGPQKFDIALLAGRFRAVFPGRSSVVGLTKSEIARKLGFNDESTYRKGHYHEALEIELKVQARAADLHV